MDSDDITDHYTLHGFGDGNCMYNTIAEARLAASGDEKRIWFIREGDDDAEDGVDDPVWSVEHWHGQFVNCLGFFVTEESCKPEHKNTIFIY